MIKGSLLHFDFEFTHPVPGVGQPMQLGLVVQPATFHDNGRVEPHLDIGTWREFETIFPVTRDAQITPWVKENQPGLLMKCQHLAFHGDTAREHAVVVAYFLTGIQAEFGEHIVPCGWTLGSDFAYLLSVLGQVPGPALVHYDGYDITALAYGLFGRNMPDAELVAYLGLPKPEREHDALADARHQSRVVNALFEDCARRYAR